MANTYQIGRLERVYVGQESAYGTAATLTATDAIRHLSCKLNQNPRNRVNSPERHSHPSQIYRFDRRKTAEWSMSGILYPSGTLNTLPDMELILLNTFGSKTNVTLATTVSASPSPTSTVFTVGSVTGLVVGDAIVINATSGGNQVRWITAINTLALTVSPALSAAPTTGDTVKGCVTYKPTTALGSSLNVAKYLTSMSLEAKGCAPESLKISVDANDEIMFEASGPAQSRIRAAQTDPATYTVVGTTPPSGLTGHLNIAGTSEEFLKASFEIKNGIELDNRAFGTSSAQAMYRARKRVVTAQIETMLSNDITTFDLSESNASTTGLVQCGTTSGSIIALWAPQLELDTPDDPTGDETLQHSYKGLCKGSAGNDEFYLAFA